MKWIYISIIYNIYNFILRLNKKSNRKIIAFTSVGFFSFCLTLIIDQIIRFTNKMIGFNYKEYHLFIVFGFLFLLNYYLVFHDPGISKIEATLSNNSVFKQKLSSVLTFVFFGTIMCVLVIIFLK
jgi:hypothetical protein